MRLRRALSLLIFGVTVAALAWVAVYGQGTEARRPAISLYSLEGDEVLTYTIPPKQSELRVDSMLAVPQEVGEHPAFEASYRLEVSWVDPEGEVVAQRIVEERGFISWVAGDVDLVPQFGMLPERDDWLTDGRLTTLPLSEFLPRGGEVSIRTTSPYPVLVRAFLPNVIDESQLEYYMLATPRRMVDQLLNKHDLPDWSTLEDTERRRLLDTFWLQQNAQSTNADPERAILFGERLSPAARRVRRQRLEPGRAMSVNMVGPVSFRLSGDSDLARLSLRRITDVPEDEDQPPLALVQDRPLGLLGEVQAFAGVIEEPHPFSLHIRNDAREPVYFYLSIDEPDMLQLFEYTPAVRHSLLLPENQEPTAEDAVLIGPELHEQIHWLIDEEAVPVDVDVHWFDERDAVGVTVRPLLEDPADDTERVLTVVGFDADGEEMWRMAQVVPVVLSRYERVIGRTDWVAEPWQTYFRRPAHRLQIFSNTPMLVRVDGDGPPTGSWRDPRVSEAQTRLRYERRAPTIWTAIQPTNTEALSNGDQVLRLMVNTRLEEVLPESRSSRGYTAAAPVGRMASRGRLWLSKGEDSGAGFCKFEPGDEAALSIRGATDRILTAVMWSPTEELGDLWGVTLDDRPWLEGVARQRVYRQKALLPAGEASVSVVGPEDGVLWLGNSNGERRCSRPYVARTYYPLGPGETGRFPVRKRYDNQLISVQALNAFGAPTPLSIRFLELQQQSEQFWRSRFDRDIVLRPQTTEAISLMEPDEVRWNTDPHGFVLRADVPNEAYTMTVTNQSTETILVRVSAEGVNRPVQEVQWLRLQEAL